MSKVKITCRLRPRIQGENDDGSVQVVHSSQSGSTSSFISVANPRDPTQVFKFPFSSCYDSTSTQAEIFHNDVQPMIDVVFSGVTVTIFAYGVTSSGKTHTMQGVPSDPGVIPRVVEAMFAKGSELQGYDSVSFTMSYLEIYKDEVFDLLTDDRQAAPKLPVRENDAGQVFVAHLSTHPINSAHQFDAIYARANKHRSVGSTNLNSASSRSHSVLTLEVAMFNAQENRTLTGKAVLVDLAGSENNKLTGNDPSRMKESSAINKSLSVLGQVVHDLNSGASRIPYRNSKLTRILSGCLGGSSIGLLICNLAPSNRFRQDTLNTLNFASRTRNIENKPVINEKDNRPVAKPHFAAIQPQAPKLAPAVLQSISSLAGSSNLAGPSRSRSSLAPRSKVPRMSTAFGSISSISSQPFGLPNLSKTEEGSSSMGMPWSEKDFEERISKAVEIEVTRRLEEREREAQRLASEQPPPSSSSRHKSKSPKKEPREVDEDVRVRLAELERKYERGSRESRLSESMSPASRKKTGRAYVSLAREQSDKGNLEAALELYRKAESYVPDNKKLQERILELEWSVKQGDKVFVPSPKRPKKTKASRKAGALNGIKDDYPIVLPPQMEDDEEETLLDVKAEPEFGVERTNTDSPGKGKRTLAEREEAGLDAVDVETPPKRQKKSGRKKKGAVVETSSDDEWAPIVKEEPVY